LHSSAEDEMGGAGSAYGEMRNTYRILVEKPERLKPLSRHSISANELVNLKDMVSLYEI
jgi:hypothetical protein